MTLLKRRKLANLSRDQLAEKSGISLISIGRYERGERIPTLDIMVKLAGPLGCSVDDLVKDFLQAHSIAAGE